MNDQPKYTEKPRPIDKEFEDPHYHDEDDVVPSDDQRSRIQGLLKRVKPGRKLPSIRPHHHED